MNLLLLASTSSFEFGVSFCSHFQTENNPFYLDIIIDFDSFSRDSIKENPIPLTHYTPNPIEIDSPLKESTADFI